MTLEDLVEELVGEIEDEFDRLPRMSHSLSGGTWMMGGGVTVAVLNATAGTQIPDEHETISLVDHQTSGQAAQSGRDHPGGTDDHHRAARAARQGV